MRIKRFNKQLLFSAVLCLALAISQALAAQNFSSNNPDGLQDPYAKELVLHDGENPGTIIHSNIFIKIVVSKNSCFLGEPILVNYLLYASIRNQSRMNRPPVFTGCSVVEMTNPDELPSLEKLNGKVYKIFSFRKVQLTPLQEGDLTIDTASIHTEVSFSSPNDPFTIKDYSATLISNSVHVQVKPLPDKNKPAGFSGITGKFHISAKADSMGIAAGENNNLHIVISGEGNLDGITEPVVNWPEGLEHFDGSDSQHIDKSHFPATGDKLFDIPFIGKKEGSYTIPNISFSFFDTETQMYKTVQSDSIPVTITRALAKHEEMKEIVAEDITNRKYVWIVPAIALIVSFIWIMTSRKKVQKTIPVLQETTASAIVPAEKIHVDFQQALQQLSVTHNNRLFFSAAKNLLTQALQQKLGTNAILENDLTQLLGETQGSGYSTAAKDMYASCNLHLYAPIDEEDKKEALLQQLTAFIQSLQV